MRITAKEATPERQGFHNETLAMISTRDLSYLPDVGRLKAAFQSMAVLDAIIMPEWEYRYYSFDDDRSPDRGVTYRVSIGSMRNGSGDDLHAIIGQSGCLIRGFAHEYPMSPYSADPPQPFPGVVEEVPTEFADCIEAMHPDWWRDITFCLWRKFTDLGWHHGEIAFSDHLDPDGSQFLLSAFDGRPETYLAWAESYYTPREFSLPLLRHVFEHRPLTAEIILALNPERSLEGLDQEFREIGYPHDRPVLPH
jgi:hypothetical protein